jgi:hypothetical protein
VTSGGQIYTTDVAYSGPASAAEWGGGVAPFTVSTPFADYGQTTFSQLSVAGPETSLLRETLSQSGVQLSTPSALDSTGFNVAYGSTTPSPP